MRSGFLQQTNKARPDRILTEPAMPLRITLKRGDAVLFNDAVTADPKNGNRISARIAAGSSGEQIRLTIRTAEGKELIAAATKIK